MIHLLICDQFPGILPASIPSYEWMFQQVFRNAGYGGTFHIYQTWQGELPGRLNQSDIYLISGSNNSANDSTPWVAALRDWTAGAFNSGCRLVGICFGHQLIAASLHGKVEVSPRGWGIGIRESAFTDKSSADAYLRSSYCLVYDHHEQVTVPPTEAVVVSGSSFCPIESYRIGRQVLTFQGHPEFSNSFIAHWIKDCAPDEPESVKSAALKSLQSLPNEGTTVARWILRFFT